MGLSKYGERVMPPRWIHETMDIIWCCKDYWQLHKERDKPFQRFGKTHRLMGHEFYWKFKNVEEFLKNIAKLDLKSEETAVAAVHDLLDKMWDDSSLKWRKWVAGFCRFLILHPDVLWQRAGVNPEKGLYKEYDTQTKSLRMVYDSKLKKDFSNLKNYVKSKTIEELLYIE